MQVAHNQAQHRLQELQDLLYAQIPLVKHLNFRVSSYDGIVLRLDAPLLENMNIFGTAFAGSLNAILTVSGWCLSWLLLQELGLQGDVMIQESSCQYLLPVTKDFSVICQRPPDADIHSFKQTLMRKGKARLDLSAEIVETSKVAVSFTGRYVGILKESVTR